MSYIQTTPRPRRKKAAASLPAHYAPDYDTAARALPDGLLDAAHAASNPGPWREAIRRETDRRYEAARIEYSDLMETLTA